MHSFIERAENFCPSPNNTQTLTESLGTKGPDSFAQDSLPQLLSTGTMSGAATIQSAGNQEILWPLHSPYQLTALNAFKNPWARQKAWSWPLDKSPPSPQATGFLSKAHISFDFLSKARISFQSKLTSWVMVFLETGSRTWVSVTQG